MQLQKQADEFKSLNTEVIFVFREEQEGVDGLKKIKDKFGTSFTLAVDLNKKSSAAYSPKKMTFDNFVIDQSGKLVRVIDGTLKDRSKAEQLIATLKEIEKKP